ncbi:MAG TPA: multiheme c-type cytochrome, partial [Methylomirabilota bacterium]
MSHRVAWGAVVAIVILAAVIGGKAPTSAPLVPDLVHAQGNYKYTGAASCGSSSCHGSNKPKAEFPKMNENIIWTQKDKHAKAYATLTNEKLKSGVSPAKIAQNLKIAKAETSSKCLVCHAVDVKPEQRGPKFDISEGVHCDGCHGPAEKWLEPHAEKGWTHEQSVKLGMYDTKSFLLRAEKCVSCHLAIEHEMVAAGHPDLLAFELDTFSATMPPHWRDKGTWAGTKAWATGQLISLREAAKQLGDRAAGNASGT